MINSLLYLYVMILPLSPWLSRIYFSSYSIMTMLSIIWFIVALIFCFQSVFKRYLQGIEILGFALLLSLAIGLIAGLLQGWTTLKIISNASVYYTPFFMYYLVRKEKPDISTLIRFATIGIIVAAIVSLLIAVGFLNSLVKVGETISYSTSYNINYVDATSGIFAIMISLYCLLDSQHQRRFIGIVLGLCGIIIVAFNQSRGYLLTVFFIIVAMVFCWFSTDGFTSNLKTALKVFFLMFLIIVVLGFTNNPVKEYVVRIFTRLNTTQIEESNISYRFSEIREYFNIFKNNPIFGKGWGLINNETVISGYTKRYRAHNTFFALLGATGLSFTPLFVIALINLIKTSIKYLKESGNKIYSLAFASVVAVVGLSTANAGFENYFCIVFIIFAYMVCLNTEYEAN